MILLRVLHAEMLKMKRTIALKMVVLAPAVILGLIFFSAVEAPFSTLNRAGVKNEWSTLTGLALNFWALLMMPLYITLETALLAGLDHSENQWKSLLARPLPRWTLYTAKLLVVMAMTAGGTLALLGGVLLEGAVLPHVQTELVFGFPVPWSAIFRDGAQVCGLAMAALAVQYWVSLRWRSFSIAVGFGIVTLIAGAFAYGAGREVGGWPQYVPWALPMLVFSKQPHNTEAALWVGGAVALLVSAAGCVEFSRREVS